MQLGFLWPAANAGQPAGPQIAPRLEGLGEEALPVRSGRWERLAYESERRQLSSPFGEFSQVWRYRLSPHVAAVSLDYPFADWHELTGCYEAQGWGLTERRVHPADAGEESESWVEVTLSKPLDRHGYLLFALFDGQGRPVDPPRGGLAERVGWRLGASRAGGVPSYQVQLFVDSYTPLTPSEQAEARSFFDQVRGSLRKQCTGSQEGSP